MVAEIKDAGLTVFPMRLAREKFSLIGVFRAILDIRNAALEMKAEVLHCVSLRCILLGWLAAMYGMKSLRVVNHVIGMGSIFSEKPKSFRMRLQKSLVSLCLMEAFKRSSAHTVFQNHDDLSYWSGRARLNRSQVSCIPGSVEWQEVKQLDGDSRGILYVGRMLRDKGIDELVQAWRLLRDQNHSCELKLCGAVDSGNPNSYTVGEMNELSSEAGIHWLGRRNDVLEQMRNAAIVVLPTYREGFPKVLLEAGMARKAVVTTDVPGCRDIVKHQTSGLLVRPRNVDELYKAIKQLYFDRALRNRLAGNLNDIVLKGFTDRTINPLWGKLYNRIL